MKLHWIFIGLLASTAAYVIYRSNHLTPPPTIVHANCADGYPSVVSRWQVSKDQDKLKVSCAPDRFIRQQQPEQVL